jgi:D-alanyl-lipoteichoic acid acyltransferase DltB (MBOAT superfamily)
MLFNSLQFLLFFAIVTLGYYSLRWNGRWVLLLLASCYFYMVFVPEFILILFGTIVIDYVAGLWIEKSTGYRRKLLLVVSLVANIGILAFFKYFNFGAENLERLLGLGGTARHVPRLDELFTGLVLPIGLSFHTFQAMSYTIEVYRGNQKAERHFGIYALYVMFYPQLVAGPIERPQNVLWQFHEYFRYDWENVKAGLMRMAWGLFKKVVIADRMALLVDPVYADVRGSDGPSLLLATLAYTFQIYCDFSGYSDIALGAARTMGFTLMENFRTPYVAASIAEFWRRWHISLSTWFRDYLYIPLGGNRVGVSRRYANLVFVFLVSGLWHGAQWTFVIWGGLHGLYQIGAILRERYFPSRTPADQTTGLVRLLHVGATFALVMLTWVFFRALDTRDAFRILAKILTWSGEGLRNVALNGTELGFCALLIAFLFWKEARYFDVPTRQNRVFWPVFAVLLLSSYFFGVFTSNQFIYFQF